MGSMNASVTTPLLAAALLLSWQAPAWAQAGTVVVSGITIDGYDNVSISIPTIEAADSTLDEAGIRALFTSDLASSATSLATLDASSIRIPEIVISYEPPDGREVGRTVTTYRDILIEDIVDGVAASSSVAATDVTGAELDFRFGRMSTGLLDIGGIFGFYGLGPDAAEMEMKPLYRDFAFDGASITMPDGNCTMGAVRAAEFDARPLKTTFGELMEMSAEFEKAEADGRDPSIEAINAMVRFYADFLTAFRSTPSTLDGFQCSGTDDEGATFSINSGPITADGFEPGFYPRISFDRFRIEAGSTGWLAFDNFTWKAMDFTGPIALIDATAGALLDEAWFVENWRRLIPALDGLSVAGLAMDVPNPEEPGERLQASIGSFDISLADYVNGIPGTVGFSAANIDVALPDNEETALLRAMGLSRVNVGYDLQARWDEASSTIAIERFALNGNDLGSIALTAVIGNAGPELFSENLDEAMVAATRLSLKSITFDIADQGLGQVMLAMAALEQGQDPAAFRAIAAGMAQAMPMAMLGATPEAMGLGNALREFVEGKPNLKLTITAKDPGGILLSDLEALESDPTVLASKVTIVAEASGEPLPPRELPALDPAPAPGEETPPVDPGAATNPDGTDLRPMQLEKREDKQTNIR